MESLVFNLDSWALRFKFLDTKIYILRFRLLDTRIYVRRYRFIGTRIYVLRFRFRFSFRLLALPNLKDIISIV